MTTTIGEELERAVAAARTVVDPELPMLTLADLGVLRAVEATAAGRVVVSLAPTWSGCPATDAMRDDLLRVLRQAGFDDVEVRLVLDPPWSTDDISAEGRRRLAEHGVAPPNPAARRGGGPVPLVLSAPHRSATCPRCGDVQTRALSEFGPTPCTSLRRCAHCLEVFEHMKER